jgi:hypothetical protein
MLADAAMLDGERCDVSKVVAPAEELMLAVVGAE